MIALLFANRRLVWIGLLLSGALGYVAWANHEHHAAVTARAQVKAAVQQAQVATVTAKAVDQAAVKTVQIETRTHEIDRTIQAAPGADAPVPPAVLELWNRGLSDAPTEPPT